MMYLVLAISVATTGLAAEIPAELQQAIQARDEAVTKKDASSWDRLTIMVTQSFDNYRERMARFGLMCG